MIQSKTPVPCGKCLFLDTHGAVTFQGEVVREGTICELDGYCWASKRLLIEMNPDYVQPLQARQRSIQTLMGIDKPRSDKDLGGKLF
jgi:hypothetical protein